MLGHSMELGYFIVIAEYMQTIANPNVRKGNTTESTEFTRM
jgi:hypothetical protein